MRSDRTSGKGRTPRQGRIRVGLLRDYTVTGRENWRIIYSKGTVSSTEKVNISKQSCTSSGLMRYFSVNFLSGILPD